jgi:hypothetical protein
MVNATPKNTTTKHVPVEKKQLGPMIAGFALLAGIYLVFAVHWILGLIVIIGSIFGIGVITSRIAKDRVSEFEASCQQHRVSYKSNYSDSGREFFLGLSEEEAILLVQFRVTDYEVKERIIKLREILNVDLVVNDLSVYKAGPIASLSAAAIGGVAFGGAGAIVGSLTSGYVGHGKIGNATLKLRANDIDEPLIEIPFVNKSVKASSAESQVRLGLAEKWTNLIEVMRFRLAEPAATPTARSYGAEVRPKYEPLQLHLWAEPPATQETTLAFRKIEEIIGSPLPDSAFEYREWWSNQSDVTNRPQARAWTNAGFFVDAVHQERINGWVRFKRQQKA